MDRLIQTVFYGVGCGMSAGWWRVQHNKHHSMPQKLGYDVDLDTLPLVAFSEKVIVYLFKETKHYLCSSSSSYYYHHFANTTTTIITITTTFTRGLLML